MREILYRGVCTETGDWVKGHYVRLFDDKGNRYHRIYPGYAESDCGDLYPDWYEIDLETVGQFTGLTDKNEKKAFEGDIFATKCNKGVIAFDDDYGTFGFQIWWNGFPDDFATFKDFGKPEFEIIGNIHDNPELLEKK